MKLFSASSMTAALCCGLLLTTSSASAEPSHKSNHKHVVVPTHSVANKVVVAKPAPIRTITTVAAVGLNRLPIGHVRFLHDDETFYYSDGVYYKKKPHGYVLVKPRAGFRVAALPRGYRVVRDGGATFYRFNNVRYRKVNGFFVVV
ncbi:MAG: hypothetical protein O3C29_07215 [Proteobacteria bacterium]|jgi:hypothetical protein|nr:hypothetical protein [Pseudomonadota bacterium]MDA1290005.1 hypothetical protein [Pseudomonadota bacterium]